MRKQTTKQSRQELLDGLNAEIRMILENVACLARNAYGSYNDKMRIHIMNKVQLIIDLDEKSTEKSEDSSAIQ